jgi:hypothetical protein
MQLETSIFQELANKSLICLIFGKRGSGKTATAMWILEEIHKINPKKKIYTIGINPHAKIPNWIKRIEDPEQAKPDSIIMVDEGGIKYDARRSMSKGNVFLSGMMAISRHNDQTLVFITQYTSTIDINILRFADIMLVKEPSRKADRWERGQIRTWLTHIKEQFKNIEGDKREYCYLDSDYGEGLVRTKMPTFWSDAISKSFRKKEAPELY